MMTGLRSFGVETFDSACAVEKVRRQKSGGLSLCKEVPQKIKSIFAKESEVLISVKYCEF